MEILKDFFTNRTDGMADENGTAVNVHVFNVGDYYQADAF